MQIRLYLRNFFYLALTNRKLERTRIYNIVFIHTEERSESRYRAAALV